jgi:hypothetical protein
MPKRVAMIVVRTLLISFALAGALAAADAQTAPNLNAIRLLLPQSTLLSTAPGRAALASNLSVTAAIEAGTAHQPILEPFDAQRQQALADATITSDNAYQLADGLGSKLGGVYRSLASYTSSDDGKTVHATNVAPSVEVLLRYTAGLAGADAGATKNFFGNATLVTRGHAEPVSPQAMSLLASAGGTTDVFGKAYGKPAGSAGADPYGDSRPFQTEPSLAVFAGTDYFGVAASNVDFLRGPLQQLSENPAFPSGHTTYGYTESVLLGILIPERYPQMIVRGAEYGNSRIMIGAHYAMDVIGGRTLAYYDLAHALADDPAYLGATFRGVTIASFTKAREAARADVLRALEAGCGMPIAACAAADTGRFHDDAADAAFYESTQTYGLALAFPAQATAREDVASLAPEAGTLLTAAYPTLTLPQADGILTETEGPGGGFLDNGSRFGVYSRLDLYAATKRAAQLAAKRR